ncbi:hypothetical protein BDV12DRAFT_199037 [Aspergillus spectabilis]
MKFFATTVIALASIPSLASAAPAPDSAPKTAVLTLKPAWGKADRLEAYVKDGQDYIKANVPSCIDIWYFWEGGKKGRMIIGERFANQSALWDWAVSDEHTQIAKELPSLIDIFSAKIQADITFDILDFIK